MLILGIESSCDETAASVALIQNEKITIISNIVSSQINIHQKYGGVVPEVAAREHVLNIIPVIDKALYKAKIKRGQEFKKLTAIAVATGPGLITSLQVGVEVAKVLAYSWNLPIVSVNHIAGHIAANFINQEKKIKLPAIILTVSGGHTKLILMGKNYKFKTIGETRDDAAGEAFDKAAKLMGIGYPGGPAIAKEAKNYNKQSIKNNKYKIILPRPMINSNNFDFSFSGLKTALRYALEKDKNWQKKIPAYATEFQQAIIDVLIKKLLQATKQYGTKTIMLAGGVSANLELRKQLRKKITKFFPESEFYLPNLKYTTDNAAMIAAAGYFQAKKNKYTPWQKLKVNCNLNL